MRKLTTQKKIKLIKELQEFLRKRQMQIEVFEFEEELMGYKLMVGDEVILVSYSDSFTFNEQDLYD